MFGGLYTDTITRDGFFASSAYLGRNDSLISVGCDMVVIWLSVNSRETASRTPP